MAESERDVEAELVRRVKAGDESAFQALFDAHVEVLTAFARRWIPPAVRRRVSASDVVQEAHLVALRRVLEFEHRGDGSLRNWLLRIVALKVRETVRDHTRAARRSVHREVSRGDRPDTAFHASPGASPSQFAEAGEASALADDALGALPPDYREVLRLARWERLSTREIAARMDRSREAVKKLYARALARFTDEFDRRRTGPQGAPDER